MRCVVARTVRQRLVLGWVLSDGKGQLVEGDSKTVPRVLVGGDLVVAPS